MADAEPATPPQAAAPATVSMVEDALSAAEGTRKAAQWMASALAGIPSLAIVASIVSGPGDNGFDASELAVGVGLAALGVALGIFVFAKVITPLSLEDSNLEGFPMTRVPGSPFATFSDLREAIATYNSTLGSGGTELAAAKAAAAMAGAEAAIAQSSVAITLERLKNAKEGSPEQAALKTQASEAIVHAQEKRNAAEEAEGLAKSLAETHRRAQGQLAAAEAIRQNVYRLKAADEVGSYFETARWALPFVIAFVAAGLVVVGVAPRSDPPAATPPSLVTLSLSPEGEKRVGCATKELQALRIGGDDKTPLVITLPTPDCPAKTLAFTTVDPAALGKATAVEQIAAE
jgi:hypothetical protein